MEKNNLENFNNHIENLEKRLKDNLNIHNMENNIKNNIENNNLINNITMEIIQLLKRKIYKQINRFVKHKSTIKAFDNYINKLGDDKEKLKKILTNLVIYQIQLIHYLSYSSHLLLLKDKKKLKKLLLINRLYH